MLSRDFLLEGAPLSVLCSIGLQRGGGESAHSLEPCVVSDWWSVMAHHMNRSISRQFELSCKLVDRIRIASIQRR